MFDSENGSSLHRVKKPSWDTIPLDLKNRPRWVAWRPEVVTNKDGTQRLNKKPVMATNPSRGASSRDQSKVRQKTGDYKIWTPWVKDGA